MITSRKNPIIKQFRKQNTMFVVEGSKLVSEALEVGFFPEIALFTESAVKKNNELFTKLLPEVITEDLAEYISDTKTPQGIFTAFRRENKTVDFELSNRLILLDGVQDPGNIGAIVRSCEAFGWDGIIFSDDSADIYNPKVIRAAAGSAFRLPSSREQLREIIPNLKRMGFKVWAATLEEEAVALKNAGHEGKTAVVIGNEGRGISKEILDLCENKLYIPIKKVESLNAGVAAGIICYVLGGI